MKNVKYINCFGTSYTAGGGFEFESTRFKEILFKMGHISQRQRFLKDYYNIKNESQTQFNFSWPGRLQKLIKNNSIEECIKVINYAKQGYGNERLYRKFYEIIIDNNFNKDEHIFLFEMSDLGRKEFWCNELNSYVILNYEIDWDREKLKKCNGLAKSWYYDSVSEFKKLEQLEDYYYDFLLKTFNMENVLEKMERDFLFFLSFLNENKIKYYFTCPPNFTDKDKVIDRTIFFGDDIYTKKSDNFIEFCDLNRLFITSETPEYYEDDHCGFLGNNIVANQVYNFLIDKNEINLEKNKIDYELISKLDRVSFIKNNSKQNKSMI